MISIIDSAFEYLSEGMSVIPLARNKKPLLKSWAPYQNRIPDKAEVQTWWKKWPSANIGIVTGKVSGITVLDFDGPGVQHRLEALTGESIPDTFSVRTARGKHVYLAYCPGIKNVVKLKHQNGEALEADIRNDGGYVVAPPSIHESGVQYQWEGDAPFDYDNWREELEPVPQGIADLIRQADVPGPQAKLDTESVLKGIPEGERDQQLFKYACSLRSRNISKAEAWTLIHNAALNCSPSFPEKEARAKLEQAWKYEPGLCGPWEPVVPLKGGYPPELDPDLLPGIVGDMARALSGETETPIELAAGLILSTIATACQGKFNVLVKPGYLEPLNLWVIVALDPANRKSATLMKITRPLTQWEQDQHFILEPWIKEAASRRKNQEARIAALRKQYGKAPGDALKDIGAEILEIESELEDIPEPPKVWAQDITPERLGSLMHQHKERMSIISAEGGIFDIAAGRYSNGVPNLDLFLQGHAGDPVRVDRGSRDPVYMNRPALTLGLSPQPGVLKGLADKPGFRSRGFLARFMYFIPKSRLGYRALESVPVSESMERQYHSLVFQLLDIEPPEDDHGFIQPYTLGLSPGAYREWGDFFLFVEDGLREGGRFEHLTDWAGKLPGAAVRIAGLLHCAGNPEHPWRKDIDQPTMKTAVELAKVFADHAEFAFDLMGADQSLEQARKVWRWIECGRRESFTKRDCFTALQGTFKKVAEIEEPLQTLNERNYLQAETMKTGGRPSVKYFVNPEIISRWVK